MYVNFYRSVHSSYVPTFFSFAVQNDFVRLSQSLQVELEKIRQGEKEVRRILQLSYKSLFVVSKQLFDFDFLTREHKYAHGTISLFTG